MPALPVVVFLPDWRVCGLRLAQETSRPEVPKTVMSRPISAMMAWAAMIPQPVISSRRATAGRMDSVRAGAGLRAGNAVGVRAPRGGDLIDQLAHPVSERRRSGR